MTLSTVPVIFIAALCFFAGYILGRADEISNPHRRDLDHDRELE
jgi:hypothetical protein